MLTKREIKKVLTENQSMFKACGIKSIGIFGSFVKGKQCDGSDIDILVEFNKKEKSFDSYMDLKMFLQKQLKRKIDLVLKEALKPRIRKNILEEVEYA